LLAPPHPEALLPIMTVLRLYRERTRVEQSCSDFETHLRRRGLPVRLDIADRAGRVSLAFTMPLLLFCG
jgi:hypothetical protein